MITGSSSLRQARLGSIPPSPSFATLFASSLIVRNLPISPITAAAETTKPSDYIPPSHQHIFGTLSDSMPDLDPTSLSIPSRFQSPFPAFPATPPPDSSPASVLPSETIGDALRKALAPNRRDGPGFLRAMDRYNTAMEEIQADVTLVRWMASRPSMKAKEWSGLVDAIHDNAYSRIVGRYSYELAVSMILRTILDKLMGWSIRRNFRLRLLQASRRRRIPTEN